MRKSMLVLVIFFIAGCGYGNKDDINFSSCNSKSFLPSLKESVSPRKFWIGVNVEIESELEFDTYSPSSTCSHTTGDQNIECQSLVRNYQSSLRRCLEHSRLMCRLNGGNCWKIKKIKRWKMACICLRIMKLEEL